MKNLGTQEKIGIAIIALSIVAIFLKAFELEESISEYGRYAAGIGIVLWYLGWVQRKKSEKENQK